MENDPLSGWEPKDEDNPFSRRMAKVFLLGIVVVLFMLIVALVLTSGCVTAAKSIIAPTPEPTPILTTTATPIPTITTPTPIPTPDYYTCPQCLKIRDWHFWFRTNVSGYQDMRTHVTVYGYQFMPRFHTYSVSWARYFLASPTPGMKWMFVYVNMYSDEDDVRQYLFPRESYAVQVDNKLYYPYEEMDPQTRVKELEEVWDYSHVESIKPYGYKITQEIGTGIIRAEKQMTLYSGRSNAADGYILFEVPQDANEYNTKIGGSFANLGGNVWWQLV